MSKQILWLDNDVPYLEPYVEALKNVGYDIRVATTLAEAEELIGETRYDLLILDVMIPTRSQEEEKSYPPDHTDRGLRSGLVFYERTKSSLAYAGTHVLVLTVRLDQSILECFIQAGLPEECFATKMRLREVPVFLRAVRSLLGEIE